jgi:hypothetical protein
VSAGGQMAGQWHRTNRRIYIFYGKENENHEVGTGVFVHKRIISAVERVEFVSDMSNIILRGRWCHIMVLNAHAKIKDKIDDMKDSFYEKLEHVYVHNYELAKYNKVSQTQSKTFNISNSNSNTPSAAAEKQQHLFQADDITT